MSSEKNIFNAKDWFLTYPQCTLNMEELLQELRKKRDIDFYCIAKEHHKDGGEHLHAYICLHERYFWRAKNNPRFWDVQNYHPNAQTCRSWKNVIKYCRKEGNYITNLDLKAYDAKQAARNKEYINTNPKKLFDDGKITYTQMNSLYKAQQIYKSLDECDKMIERKCFWIYGDPGVGKSYLVRDMFDSLYEKPMNKWWDNYHGQKTVLIDDFDKAGKCLGHYMKIWGDNYRFEAEIKGGMITPIYTCMIVTSNYTIDEIFEDEKERDAIKRRFKTIQMLNRAAQQIIKDTISGSCQGIGKNGGAEMEKKKKKHLVKSKFYITK